MLVSWLTVSSSLLLVVGPARSQKFDCQLSDEISLYKDETVFLSHFINVHDATITMRLRYTDGLSWVGIGINTEGRSNMMPARAVIGDVDRGVRRYSLQSDDNDGSGVVPMDDREGSLKEASFEQTEIGESILTFSHPLVDLGFSDSSVWIWAVGLPENAWAGKHRVHGSFNGLRLFDGCIQQIEAPDPSSTVAQTTKDPAGNGGQGAVPTRLPTMAPTVTPSEVGEIDEATSPATNPVYGQGGTNLSQGISNLESSSDTTQGLWVAHGTVMALAWGGLAPLAIGAAYLRHLAFLKNNTYWLLFHFYLSLSVIVLTVVGFIVAVVATKKEGNLQHFQEDVHRKVGLTILVLVLIQAVAGCARPSPPPKLPPVSITDTDSDSSPMKAKIEDGQGFEIISIQRDQPSSMLRQNSELGIYPTSTMYSTDLDFHDDEEYGAEIFPVPTEDLASSEAPSDESNINSNGQPSPSTNLLARKLWECFHRLTGVTLLGLAWYNCHSGIFLQCAKFDRDGDEAKLLGAFWGVTGTIAGLIFLVGYAFRL